MLCTTPTSPFLLGVEELESMTLSGKGVWNAAKQARAERAEFPERLKLETKRKRRALRQIVRERRKKEAEEIAKKERQMGYGMKFGRSHSWRDLIGWPFFK